MVMFGVEAYDSITWYGEHEQAVLLTELLFRSTQAEYAGQEKCSSTNKAKYILCKILVSDSVLRKDFFQ